MRPWTASPPTRSRTPCGSFNGTTALRPWTEKQYGGTPPDQYVLQWGHGLAAVDGLIGRPARIGPRMLQWGHGLAAVDGPEGVRGQGAHGASMGPRPCGRGRRAKPAYRRTRELCFNGATALRPWTVRTCGAGAPVWTRFNGATALRPWTAHTGRRGRGRGLASMGPRPCGRGRLKRLPMHSPSGLELQWGHGLAAVDGAAPAQCSEAHFEASMGPRPCGRGRSYRAARRAAEAGLQWGHGLAAVDGAAWPHNS